MDINVFTPITIGFFTAFIMGPVFWVLLETSITKGFKAALAFDIGVLISDVVFLIICFFGSSQLKSAKENQEGLYVLGGTILLVYGIIYLINRSKKRNRNTELNINKENYFGLAVKGFALNIINVGVLIYWLAATSAFAPAGEANSTGFVLFFSIVLFTYFIVDLFKIIVANRFSRLLTDTTIVFINTLISIILIISGVVFIIKGFEF
ncbi:MAG: lysine transporter LysE [Flavobacteriaceae bacterium]|nr:lysine transporter LysE [Flavobacteriaceae bacterium]